MPDLNSHGQGEDAPRDSRIHGENGWGRRGHFILGENLTTLDVISGNLQTPARRFFFPVRTPLSERPSASAAVYYDFT